MCSACTRLTQLSEGTRLALRIVSQYFFDPLCSLPTTISFCPGETGVSASARDGGAAPAPCGGATSAENPRCRTRLSACSVWSCFSESACSNEDFKRVSRSVSFNLSTRSLSSTALSESEFTSERSLPLIFLSVGNNQGTSFSSSATLRVRPGRLVSIPSNKSFSCPFSSFVFGTTESTSL